MEMSERTRCGAEALGLALQCPGFARHSATMTGLACSAPTAVRDGLKARGILTAAGLGRFVADGFRIGHMGDIRLEDVERTLDALSDVLAVAA
jgi:aspartate aminotransferase-like enzyme